MNLRSVLGRPPAIAGLALLALVVVAVLVVRVGLDDGETQVAGNVIERPDPAATDPAPASPPPLVVRPSQDDDDDEPRSRPEPRQLVQPDPAPGTGGTVGEPVTSPPASTQDTDTGTDTTPRRERNPGRDPEPKRDPKPKPKPKPEPKPEPEPEPEPDDTAKYALRDGSGHSRDTAIADDGDWMFLSVDGHGGQSQTSRQAQARLTVGFSQAAKQGSGPARDLSCHAVLTSGSRRLMTDRAHTFEVALWTADEDGVPIARTDSFVYYKKAFDLAPNQQRVLSMDPVEYSAEDGVNYTCVVTYSPGG